MELDPSPTLNLPSPTATHRSPEDQDLLARSTKKPKRRREMLGPQMDLQSSRTRQESPSLADIASPESNQWTTPAASPSSAWTRRTQMPPMEEEYDSDDDVMNENLAKSEYPVILVTKEEKERLRRPWRKSLIIKLLGRTVGYSFLLQKLQRMWKPEAPFELIALDLDYFLVKFESTRDLETAMYGGPWLVLDHYLVVQRWEPNFDPRNKKTKKLLVWIRFPTMPIEYFEEEFLMRLGKGLGKPVKIDLTTGLVAKGKFARICVEIDISQPLMPKYVLDEKEWLIEYEGFHLVCFECGTYGHRQENCGKIAGVEVMDSDHQGGSQPERPQPITSQEPPKKYGAWMLVSRKERRHRPKGQNNHGVAKQQETARTTEKNFEGIGEQSCFASLDGLEEEQVA
ncbi:PREDICTED: uncharacterized protein LOC109173568 [Ipomoea nil]|uniref:uncharacterized protein LOC109173568 n=1 Tax=Ipomoea nil TaxID=35883 RepID=UPI00090111AC|nr:PREDICTED: uncharacterized protein LOC109173568 [Ipomoea nil]